jgi:hypothetical protein
MERTILTARLASIKRKQIPKCARRASDTGEDLNSAV